MPQVETHVLGADAADDCARLAYQVFCEEMGTLGAHADHERRLLHDDIQARARMVGAFADGELVGSLGVLWGGDGEFPRTFREGLDLDRYAAAVPRERIGVSVRFLVREDYRSSSVPFRLIAESTRLQVGLGITLAFCDCQPHLVPLYSTLGFRPCAPLFDQPGFGMMVPMLLSVVDRGWLRGLRSPLLRHLPEHLDDPAEAATVVSMLPAEPPVLGAAALGEQAWSELYGLLSTPGNRPGALDGMSQPEVDHFLAQSRVIRVQPGQQIIVRGQGTRTVFVVLEGDVEVRRGGRRVATLATGEMFGEFALLLDARRSADVHAGAAGARILALDERSLARMIDSRSALAARFLLNVSRALALRLVGRE